MFNSQPDYFVPLLRLLADEFPDGAKTSTVCKRFLQRYRDQIPPHHTDHTVTDGSEPWEVNVRWSRNTLCRAGLMDDSVRGYWRLTQTGKEWLAQHPDASQLDAGIVGSHRSGVTRPRSPVVRIRKEAVAPSGLDISMLEQTRQVMPAEQFRRVWGALYDKLRAEESAKVITQVTDKGILLSARQQIRRIQEYLKGHTADSPKSEELCDWILFAYTFELHHEAAALWQYVRQDEVNPWQCERTKKLVMVCRTRVGG
jgi:hypothetical protein